MNAPGRTIDYPQPGDFVDLGEGPETPLRLVDRLVGWVWPLGTPAPAWYDVVDAEGRDYRVLFRFDSPVRTWSGERRRAR